MRVLMLTWEYPPRMVGGMSRHCYSLSKSLAKGGCEVFVITLAHEEAKTYERIEDKVAVIRVKSPPHPDFITWTLFFNQMMEIEASGLFRSLSFDLIHAHDWLTVPAAVSLKHCFNIPMILTIHSTERGRRGEISTPFDKMINDVEWWGTYEANCIITVSKSMRDEVLSHFRPPSDKVYVINNGVNVSKFKKRIVSVDLRNRFAAPYERIVLFVGRLVWEKGAQYLLEAAPLIMRECQEVKFVIVGEGGMRSYLESKANSYGIGQKVYITGFLNDETLTSLYAVSDVLVVPSLYEPFGLTALEGMASGVPVVASSVGGLKEVIVHDVNGVLIDPQDPQSIAWGVNKVLSDPAYAGKLVKNAQERVKDFEWNKVGERTIEVYRRALTKRA